MEVNKRALKKRPLSPTHTVIAGKVMHPDEIDFLLDKYGISGTVEKKKPTKPKMIRLATEQ